MPLVTIDTELILFDLDGTLIYSTDAVTEAWTAFFKKHNMILKPEFFHDTHGMRTIEAFQKYFPLIDDKGGLASSAFDLSIAEEYGTMAQPIPGGPQLIQSIPLDRWCVVTSGSRGIAHSWFKKVLIPAGLPKPHVFLTSDDVTKGKPHPQPYLKGAELLGDKLGFKITKAVVFEDAPTGIKAGVAAGFIVVGVMSTFGKDVLIEAGASYAVEDLTHVKVNVTETGLELQIDAA